MSKHSIFRLSGGWGGGGSFVSLPLRKSNVQVGEGSRLILTNEALEADFPLRIRLGCIAAHVGTDS